MLTRNDLLPPLKKYESEGLTDEQLKILEEFSLIPDSPFRINTKIDPDEYFAPYRMMSVPAEPPMRGVSTLWIYYDQEEE